MGSPVFSLLTKRCLLYSLKTETEPVRARLAAFLEDLISLGVDGFRIDAAKRTSLSFLRSSRKRLMTSCLDMPTTDIRNILDRLSKSVYVTQEATYAPGEQVLPSEYLINGVLLVVLDHRHSLTILL